MPLGGGEAARVALSQFVPYAGDAPAHRGARSGPLPPLPRTERLADEARNFRLSPTGPGVVGFISPVSEPYCGSCNRMRLTADGKFHLCLLNDDELDVRSGAAHGRRACPRWRRSWPARSRLKPTGHRLEEGVSTEERAMFQIGG